MGVELVCNHENARVVWVPIGEKSIARQLRQQCQKCGLVFGKALPHTQAPPDTPVVDQEAWDRFKQYHRADWENRRNERRARYEQHLASPQWAEIRRKVLARAGGICEGCGENPASEIHHLTYAHCGAEFLFELAAVCVWCHRLLHESGEYRAWWMITE
jgi:5-methylcytosine-specific restriction endonuclease McrA